MSCSPETNIDDWNLKIKSTAEQGNSGLDLSWFGNGKRGVLLASFALSTLLFCLLVYLTNDGLDFVHFSDQQSFANSGIFSDRLDRDKLDFSENETLDIFDRKPPVFMEDYKNPCWIGNLTSGHPYVDNIYRRKGGKAPFVAMDKLLTQRKAKGKDWRIRCLPYFYLAGFPKSGTTDLFTNIVMHPEVTRGNYKEPHWWSRWRVGKGKYPPVPIRDYVDTFDNAAETIRQKVVKNKAESNSWTHPMIVGDGSASTLWDNDHWRDLADNQGSDEEPKYTTADLVHYIQPKAKIIVIMRDPTFRLYSDFLYFKSKNKTAADFHQAVTNSIDLMNKCLESRPLRSCVYDLKLSRQVECRIRVGMYYPYVEEWLRVFPKEQLFFLRLEDYSVNRVQFLNQICDFLGIGPFPKKLAQIIKNAPRSNSRTQANQRLGPMLNKTMTLLKDFYMTFNTKLSVLLGDDRYLWDS